VRDVWALPAPAPSVNVVVPLGPRVRSVHWPALPTATGVFAGPVIVKMPPLTVPVTVTPAGTVRVTPGLTVVVVPPVPLPGGAAVGEALPVGGVPVRVGVPGAGGAAGGVVTAVPGTLVAVGLEPGMAVITTVAGMTGLEVGLGVGVTVGWTMKQGTGTAPQVVWPGTPLRTLGTSATPPEAPPPAQAADGAQVIPGFVALPRLQNRRCRPLRRR